MLLLARAPCHTLEQLSFVRGFLPLLPSEPWGLEDLVLQHMTTGASDCWIPAPSGKAGPIGPFHASSPSIPDWRTLFGNEAES